MRKTLLLLVALFRIVLPGVAQEMSLPTIHVLPEDIVQNSIQQVRFGTNSFAVRWTYTEAGAQKMIAFWEGHVGQKTHTFFGDFPMPPAMGGSPVNPEWKAGWLKRRTEKIFVQSTQDADRIEAGLKAK